MNVRGNYVVKSHVNNSSQTQHWVAFGDIHLHVGTMFMGAIEITRA